MTDPCKCNPGDWIMPKVGDDYLVCKQCGCKVNLLDDPKKIQGILVSISMHRDCEYSDRFREAFRSAEADSQKRNRGS